MQVNSDYSLVRTLIAVDNPVVRKGLQGFFMRTGFTQIAEASSYIQVHNALRENDFDLIITISEMGNFFVGHLIREIRHNVLGNSPFPVVVMLLPSAEHDYVKKVVDCGPDDLLLIPVAPDQLFSRVQQLIQTRKPFVVTYNYIGPDRRKQKRDGGEVIPLVEIPNPIKARATRMPPASMQRDIDATIQRINTLKIERDSIQIRWLVDAIMNAHREGRLGDDSVVSHIFGLTQMAEDLKKRTAHWANDRIPVFVNEMDAAVRVVSSLGAKSNAVQLEQLSETCRNTVQEIMRSLPHQSSELAVRG